MNREDVFRVSLAKAMAKLLNNGHCTFEAMDDGRIGVVFDNAKFVLTDFPEYVAVLRIDKHTFMIGVIE